MKIYICYDEIYAFVSEEWNNNSNINIKCNKIVQKNSVRFLYIGGLILFDDIFFYFVFSVTIPIHLFIPSTILCITFYMKAKFFFLSFSLLQLFLCQFRLLLIHKLFFGRKRFDLVFSDIGWKIGGGIRISFN